jgi:hypothetical protein
MNRDAAKIREQLREHFFEVSAQGILVYQDPVIGPLFHARKKIAVHVNIEQSRLELKVNGKVQQTFDFTQNIGRTCHEVCGAYFTLVSRQADQEKIQAA